jgi:signal transduction histidine kinase
MKSSLLGRVRSPSRALLVASDTELARQVEQILHRLGCEIVEVTGDGVEALKRCTRLAPELVLIDLRLSAGNAIQVAAQLAERVSGPLLYLGEDKAELPEAALDHGYGWIDLPLRAADLQRALSFALHRYHVQSELERRATGERDSARPGPDGVEPEAAGARLSGELLASMAHELRAPLQGVVGFAAFLRDGKSGEMTETQQQYLDYISNGANHVLQVVNDVLDLTATDSDTLHVRTEAVDPEQAAREVLQVLQVIAIRRRIAVDVQVDEQLGHVVSDATKLKQVLYNFVSNALKFTPTGGRVSVSLRREGPDTFCIEVADTGVGIASETLPRLFERKAHRSGATRGLGLSITKRIVDALGGSVAAQNRAEGGSVFSARLPIAPSVANLAIQDILLPKR